MRKPILIIVIAAVVVLLAAGSLALVINASSDTSSPATSNLIGEDEAYRIALEYANVSETDVTRKKIVFDREVGRDEWDVEFWVGTNEYDCEIDAVTGEVLHFESDAPVASTGSGDTAGTVTEAEAKAAALTHAGVAEADITNYRCEIDYDNGRKAYEIEFYVGTTEYDYTVDATNGAILSYERDENKTPTGTTSGGNAPSDTSVTEAEAKATVLTHSGVAEADITNYRCKIDYDNGRKEYEIEFYVGTTEYDYTVDATNGAILSYERDEHNTPTGTTPGGNTPLDTSVTEAEAKAVVLQHSGVAEADITNYRCKIDYDNGRKEYDIEFYVGTTEYDYTVDATNGAILSYELDEHKTSTGTTSGGNTPSGTSVTEAEAKAAVLTHAGVTEADITNYRCEIDYDDGRKEYEIEFYVGTTEYDYTVDASSGAILSHEREDHHHSSSSGNAGTATVTEAQAKKIALEKAKLSESEITGYRSKLERDDGRLEYEIEFRANGLEYEFTIDAETGKILDFDIDNDD